MCVSASPKLASRVAGCGLCTTIKEAVFHPSLLLGGEDMFPCLRAVEEDYKGCFLSSSCDVTRLSCHTHTCLLSCLVLTADDVMSNQGS